MCGRESVNEVRKSNEVSKVHIGICMRAFVGVREERMFFRVWNYKAPSVFKVHLRF